MEPTYTVIFRLYEKDLNRDEYRYTILESVKKTGQTKKEVDDLRTYFNVMSVNKGLDYFQAVQEW